MRTEKRAALNLFPAPRDPVLEKYKRAYAKYEELWRIAYDAGSDESVAACQAQAQEVEGVLHQLRPLLLASPEGKKQWARIRWFLSPSEKVWRHRLCGHRPFGFIDVRKLWDALPEGAVQCGPLKKAYVLLWHRNLALVESAKGELRVLNVRQGRVVGDGEFPKERVHRSRRIELHAPPPPPPPVGPAMRRFNEKLKATTAETS